jgi:ferredoxin
MEGRIRQPLVLEATAVKGGQMVLLGYIPHDSRRLGYNLAYAHSLTALQVAKRHGGRAYAAGLYLPQEAPAVYGERLARWRQLKAATDPHDTLNPGKLEGQPGLRALIGLANSFSFLIRPFANAAKAPLGERWTPMGELPGSTVWYAYSCSQCGYCRTHCTLYDGRGWESASPRGKWYYLRLVAEGKEKLDQEMVNTFLMCTTCERCDFNCQLDLPVESSWAAMRGELVNS